MKVTEKCYGPIRAIFIVAYVSRVSALLLPAIVQGFLRLVSFHFSSAFALRFPALASCCVYSSWLNSASNREQDDRNAAESFFGCCVLENICLEYNCGKSLA